MCRGPKLQSCWCQKSCSAQHLKGLWHSATLDYLWGHRAHYQWRQRCFTGNTGPVFSELEQCDKISGATTPWGPPLIKADRALLMSCLCPNTHQSCFCHKDALAHKCIDMCSGHWVFDWEVQNECIYQVGDSRSSERKESWKELGRMDMMVTAVGQLQSPGRVTKAQAQIQTLTFTQTVPVWQL